MKTILIILALCLITTVALAGDYVPTDKAKVLTQDVRQYKLDRYVAKLLNQIENHKAKIAKIEREIKELKPEELEFKLTKDDDEIESIYWTGTSPKATLVIN